VVVSPKVSSGKLGRGTAGLSRRQLADRDTSSSRPVDRSNIEALAHRCRVFSVAEGGERIGDAGGMLGPRMICSDNPFMADDGGLAVLSASAA